MSLVVDTHREYLSDAARLNAFVRAIAATVRPGDVVIDLGSGTGILALLACRAGAARVHAIEADGMIEVARAIARDNGCEDRITFHSGHSSEVQLPEPADVLVCDLVGGMGFEAGIFESYGHVRRWLKPEARVVPRAIEMLAAPIEHAAMYDQASFWRDAVAGFDMSAALRWSLHTGYPRHLEIDAMLSAAPISATFEPLTHTSATLQLAGTVAATKDGQIHGLGVWCRAHLAPGVTMTNAPGDPHRIMRRNSFLPLEQPAAVAAGEPIGIDIRIRPADMLVSWRVDAGSGAERRRSRNSTLSGMLLTREMFRLQRPESMPRLTPRGEARRSLLELCDGAHPLETIEREVFRRHPGLFPTIAEAQAFVAEVVTRYGVLD